MFIQNNQGFICDHCGREVRPHPSSSRDHCNWCLYGLHVDKEPGDRQETCHGTMEPIGLEIKQGKTQIVYRCSNCNAIRKNISAPDDDSDKIIELAHKAVPIKEN